MSLYTKYRPKDWDELIGQNTIRTILQTSLKNDTVSHAYIFTGSRGTGKTTSARILAKAINCTHLQDGSPCHECKNCRDFDDGKCIDVIEIDAASHTQVDKMRDLIESAKFAPTQGEYKIYIIDEVHMLSQGAFNALLKTLEEPPAHVKFILATTEIHKVPETIRSRALRFDFGKVATQTIFEHLKSISEQEGISADENALQIIARAARGGVRDALTLLEQNTIDGTLSKERVMQTLSIIDESYIQKIIDTIVRYDVESLKKHIVHLKKEHIEVQGFFDSILYHLRDKMIETLGENAFDRYADIMDTFQENYRSIKIIPDGLLLIEITLLRACQPKTHEANTFEGNGTTKEIPVTSKGVKKDAISKQESSKEGKIQKSDTPPKKVMPQPSEIPQKTDTSDKNSQGPVENFSYRRLLDALADHSGIRFAMKSASFSQEGCCLTLSFTSQWNHDKVADLKSTTVIQEKLNGLFGGSWTLTCKINQNPDTNHIDDVFV